MDSSLKKDIFSNNSILKESDNNSNFGESQVKDRVKSILTKIANYTDQKKSAIKKITTAKKSARKENYEEDILVNCSKKLNFMFDSQREENDSLRKDLFLTVKVLMNL